MVRAGQDVHGRRHGKLLYAGYAGGNLLRGQSPEFRAQGLGFRGVRCRVYALGLAGATERIFFSFSVHGSRFRVYRLSVLGGL